MLWEDIEGDALMLLVHGDAPPDEAEWDEYAAKLHELHDAGRLKRVLVFGEGPGPSALQRQKLHHDRTNPVKTAVVTHSLFHRGIVTALSWFFEIEAFAPSELDRAFEFLEVPRGHWSNIRQRVGVMRMRFAGTPELAPTLELTGTIDKLDELATDRLPKLRERVRRGRGS